MISLEACTLGPIQELSLEETEMVNGGWRFARLAWEALGHIGRVYTAVELADAMSVDLEEFGRQEAARGVRGAGR